MLESERVFVIRQGLVPCVWARGGTEGGEALLLSGVGQRAEENARVEVEEFVEVDIGRPGEGREEVPAFGG